MSEFAVDSTGQRILNIVIEEELAYYSENEDEEEISLRDSIRGLILQEITDFMDEIEISVVNIANQALEHIHSRYSACYEVK
jgi:hypothetical protein